MHFQHFKCTHHPHHEVGEDGDPQSGQDEGQHEALLPASFGTVWDGEEEQQEQRPREQPFHFVANVPCSSEKMQVVITVFTVFTKTMGGGYLTFSQSGLKDSCTEGTSPTWNVKRRDGVALLCIRSFVLRHVSVLDFNFPVNHLRLHAVGSLEQLLALSRKGN